MVYYTSLDLFIHNSDRFQSFTQVANMSYNSVIHFFTLHQTISLVNIINLFICVL
jgi:hypothetical protein